MKKLLVLSMIVFMASGITAFYLLSYTSPVLVGQVTGGVSAFGITQQLQDFSIDVGSGNLSLAQRLILENDNSVIEMNYSLTTSVVDIDPSCDASSDITFELSKVGYGTIDPNTNFTMEAGTSEFDFIVTAISDKSCPANLTAQIQFNEI